MSSIYTDHKPEGGSGTFLKLKDGDKVQLRIASEPVVTLWKDGDKVRYGWGVWNRDLEKAQVFGAGVSIYNQIAELVDGWGEPTEFDITIKRSGSGLNDTEYFVAPVKESFGLNDSSQKAVDDLDLLKATGGKWLKDYAKDGIPPKPRVEVSDTVDDKFSEKDVPDFNS